MIICITRNLEAVYRRLVGSYYEGGCCCAVRVERCDVFRAGSGSQVRSGTVSGQVRVGYLVGWVSCVTEKIERAKEVLGATAC